MVFLQIIHQQIHHPGSKELDLYIQMIAEGSQDGLEALYHNTSAAIYAYALSVLKNPHDAEDILHECYLRIHTAAGSYRSSGKPMAWIMTIAKNLCRMQLRDRQKTAPLSEEDWSHYLESNSEFDPDDRIVLTQCMERLSQTERQIVSLHIVAGFKHREIAQFLEMPLATVLSKYHRSLKKLSVYFKGENLYEK